MADITDLIARLREWGIPTAVRAADALTAQAATIAEQARELEALRADAAVRQAQVDSLRDALRKVLYTRNKEAKASMSYRVARENFGDSNYERKAHERAMFAASDAEREARLLLATLKTPNVEGESCLAAHQPSHTTTATPQGVASTD